MPGSDFDFEFRWVPNNYQSRVQRSAVLYPLMGIAHTPAQISAKTSQLLHVWRARATVLMDAGWSPREGDRRGLVYARNCLPTFVYAVPKARPCKTSTLCPFCYARWVSQVWGKIDNAFPYGHRATGTDEYHPLRRNARDQDVQNDIPAIHVPDEDQSHMDGRALRSIVLDDDDVAETTFPFHLVELHIRDLVAYNREDMTREQVCRGMLEELVERRARRMRGIQAIGSFVYTIATPSPRGWRIRQRELHQVRPDYEIEKPLIGHGIRYLQPTRRHVFHAVAHACRYPKELMYGDCELIAMLLRCRQGRRNLDRRQATKAIRLSATYGSFRSKTTT